MNCKNEINNKKGQVLKKKEYMLDLYRYSLKYLGLFENRRFEKFFELFFE